MLGIQVAVSPEVTKALVFLFSPSSLPTHMYEPKQLKKNHQVLYIQPECFHPVFISSCELAFYWVVKDYFSKINLFQYYKGIYNDKVKKDFITMVQYTNH